MRIKKHNYLNTNAVRCFLRQETLYVFDNLVIFKSLQCANNDVIAGWCESGSIFIADARQL
jgi:hypothetical protein